MIVESILQLIAGIGLFVFAMSLLEDALKNLAGRPFKLFLQRHTSNRFKAIISGALVTGVLQSSSVVSVLVLAFVGAGVLTLKSALAVIIGANVGSTFNSWLVALLGFKVNIDLVAYPAVGVAGILLIAFSNSRVLKNIARFLMGFGLIFIGLSFMKTSLEEQVHTFDFSKYAHYPLIIFLVIGLVITAIIQSSSTTMALTLTALNANVLPFPAAAAIIVGAEVGTALKLQLGAWKGIAAKKQLATGTLFFNILTTFIAFGFLRQLLFVITDVFNIKDPLIGLVLFQTTINVLSIIVILPFLNAFTKLLQRLYHTNDNIAAAYLQHSGGKEISSTLEMLRMETSHFINNALLFGLSIFEVEEKEVTQQPELHRVNEQKEFYAMSFEQKYEFLKQLQGEIQSFYIRLLAETVAEKDLQKIEQLISAVRSGIHAAKSIKDIERNITNLRESSKDFKFNLHNQIKKQTVDLYLRLNKVLNESKAPFDELQQLFTEVQNNFNALLAQFYAEAKKTELPETDITTIINLNRELFTSNKAIIIAVKDYLLEEKQAEEFNDIPVYMT